MQSANAIPWQPTRHLAWRGKWRWAAVAISALVIFPLLVIALSWLQLDTQVWLHLAETQLSRLISNTLILMVGVAVGVTFIGVGLAWLTSLCEFPGRRFWDWALMLPLAVPTYVLAFVFVGLFDFAGPVQSAMRDWFGSQFRMPDIRQGAWGIICVMTLVLYPYVYMLARSAFLRQGSEMIEAARCLGSGTGEAVRKVVFPMARPAIVAGLALALMETLADFGAVAVFNYDTFTTAIYKAWYGLFSLPAAAQLASLLLLFVALGLMGERKARGQARYYQKHRGTLYRHQLTGWRRWAACGFSALVFGAAFVLPMGQLLIWAFASSAESFNSRYLDLVLHTLSLAAIAAVVAVVLASVLAQAYLNDKSKAVRFGVRTATLGYALPGSVLAAGVALSFGWMDKNLVVPIQGLFGLPPQQILLGSIGALILAYCVRFMTAAFQPIETSLERIRPSIVEAAHSLGMNSSQIIRRIQLPLILPGLLTALLLVFVDVMKEMPATLLMRPFGWDTLAVRIYELTSEGEWQRAALPALTLVMVGLVPVILLMRRMHKVVAGSRPLGSQQSGG